jgi:uncharacterized protein
MLAPGDRENYNGPVQMGTDNLPEQASLKVTQETQATEHSLADSPGSGDISTGDPEDFHALDRRVIRLWRTTAGIRTGVLLLAGIVAGTFLQFYHGASLLLIFPLWLGLVLLVLLETHWLPLRRYRSTSFRLGEGFFEFRSGIFWKSSVMIPLSRIQHIDLLRGPLEQRYGLASLVLHTAGTSQASQTVPGLEVGEAVRIRQRIAAAADIDWDEEADPDSGN